MCHAFPIRLRQGDLVAGGIPAEAGKEAEEGAGVVGAEDEGGNA